MQPSNPPDTNALAGPDVVHDPRYDTEVPIVQEPHFAWLLGARAKSQSELRDEDRNGSYCRYLASLEKVLNDKNLQPEEASKHADYYVQKIQEMGGVNANTAGKRLSAIGLDDERRQKLQTRYQDLKAKLKQKLPYGKQRTKVCC